MRVALERRGRSLASLVAFLAHSHLWAFVPTWWLVLVGFPHRCLSCIRLLHTHNLAGCSSVQIFVIWEHRRWAGLLPRVLALKVCWMFSACSVQLGILWSSGWVIFPPWPAAERGAGAKLVEQSEFRERFRAKRRIVFFLFCSLLWQIYKLFSSS